MDRAREIAAEGDRRQGHFRDGFARQYPVSGQSFDAVFSKDSLIHVVDKKYILTEIFRVLKPGGWLVAGDWMTWDEGRMTASMRDYIKAEGLDFHMGSSVFTRRLWPKSALQTSASRTGTRGIFPEPQRELRIIRGDMFDEMAALVGEEEIKRQVVWEKDAKGSRVRRASPGAFPRLETVTGE